MLISASRRTDIPAFYSRWFMNRIRAGFVDVVNPFNPAQKKRVSLDPDSVDAIIFWTRNPRPLLGFLKELDERGHRYYFTYTITGYPRELDTSPAADRAVATFKELSGSIGPGKVIWRYDPIVLSSVTDIAFHRGNFHRLASSLSGYTSRVVISFLDFYNKAISRMKRMTDTKGIEWYGIESRTEHSGRGLVSKTLPLNHLLDLAGYFRQVAEGFEMEIESCSEQMDLLSAGIRPGKCIDSELLNRLFGLSLPYEKDIHQRKECLCTASVDIGAYDTCGYRCIYCYACRGFGVSLSNMRKINQEALTLWPY